METSGGTQRAGQSKSHPVSFRPTLRHTALTTILLPPLPFHHATNELKAIYQCIQFKICISLSYLFSIAQCWHRSKKESNTPLQGNSMSCFFFFFFKQICTEKKKKSPDHDLYYTVTLFSTQDVTGARSASGRGQLHSAEEVTSAHR